MDRTSSLYARMICTVLFCTFSLVYLYCFQSDILFRLQHAASGGRTYYVPVVGALLITIVLKLLQTGVYAVTRLHKRWYSITYLPSCLIMAFLTSLGVDASGAIDYAAWTWLAPVSIVLYVIVAVIAKGSQSIEPAMRSRGVFSQLVWINVMQMVAFFLMVVLLGISDEQTRMEAHGQHVIYSSVRQYASVVPQKAEEEDAKEKSKKKTEEVEENTDSILCDMLVNRDLNAFAMKIKASRNLDKSIPTVYAEALQLYMSTSRQPRYYWNNKALAENLRRFLMEKNRAEATKNRNAFKKHFGNTYWIYYYM